MSPQVVSPLSYSSIVDSPSLSPTHLNFCQLQVIQLVECASPPTPRIKSAASATFASTPTASSSSIAYPSEQGFYSSDDDDDETESVCSSYCSSDATTPEGGESSSRPSSSYQKCDGTMKRVFAWRETFIEQCHSTPHARLKRKQDDSHDNDEDGDDHPVDHDDDDAVAKRPCSQDGENASAVTLYSCPACDASFSTRHGLCEHGRAAGASEACSTAVEYSLE